MAKNQGWWRLELTDNRPEELSDYDREHIAECILGGNTQGNIVENEEWEDLNVQ